ncbi:hypothetical protein HDU86_007936 [Geranomyces michiganensis]|nr:hypothetical protein HDU86_007936 [Geranomyces michiganensis]
MTAGSVEVRQAAAADLAFIMSLVNKEQWNPGVRDGLLFHRTDPHGFFIATFDGKPIGCISAVSYACGETPPSFGFIGLYIIVPEHRGKGFGIALWNQAMSRLKNHRTIGLDGVVAQEPNYRKSGFATAYRDLRHMGTQFPPPLPESEAASLVPLDHVPIEDLVTFDARYFSVKRRRFLENWAEQTPEMHGVALLDKADGKIQAYGVIRQSAVGQRVGPLFAQDADSARIVLLQLTHLGRAGPGCNSESSSSPVFVDVPNSNTNAVKLMQTLGMEVVFECARMYHGPAPEVKMDGIYATTTLELG